MLRLAALAVGLAMIAGCGPAPPSFESLDLEVRTLPVPVRAYNSAVWMGNDRIALANLGDVPHGSRIILVDTVGFDHADITPPVRPACAIQKFFGLARTSMGELGFTESCKPVDGFFAIEFAALTLETGALRRLGSGVSPSFNATWAADGSIVYAVHDSLCATLYHRTDVDRPLSMQVEVDGYSFAVGQDLSVTPDGCPVGGRASFPDYAPDGQTLAFMASSDGDVPIGQGLVDRPWTIFVVRDGEPVAIFDGVTDPRDLVWTADGLGLLIAGRVGGRIGLWSVASDGSGLTLVAPIDPIEVAVQPDGGAMVVILSRANPNGDLAEGADVVVIELPRP